MRYNIQLSSAAARALSEDLPEAIAAAAWEFIHGPLAENPRRVGKPLMKDVKGVFSARRGTYRILYTINDKLVVVRVIKITHRRDAYH